MTEHPAARTATDVEWFQASGRGTGLAILALWVVIAVFCVTNGADLALFAALLVAAVLTYATLLRPRVGTTSEHLVYRQMFSDLRIPLASIDAMEVSRYFQVTVADKRYISPAVGRSRRAANAARRSDAVRDPMTSYGDLVEDLTRSRIADAKARASASGSTPGEARRTWAPIEIALGVVAVLFLIVTLAT